MNEQQALEVVDDTLRLINFELSTNEDYDSAINLQDSAVYHLLENNQSNYALLLIQSTAELFERFLDKQWGID